MLDASPSARGWRKEVERSAARRDDLAGGVELDLEPGKLNHCIGDVGRQGEIAGLGLKLLDLGLRYERFHLAAEAAEQVRVVADVSCA